MERAHYIMENVMKKKILTTPSRDNFASALNAWRLLLIASLIGGLIGAALYQLWSPPYRAMAIVVIDQNLEQALPAAPDREVFYFLERETQKLEALAWSDEVMGQVADEVKSVGMAQLRGGLLKLSQPGDGGWRMYGIARTPERARQLARTWANVFTEKVEQVVAASRELASVQKELTSLEGNLTPEAATQRTNLEARATMLEAASFAIHPQVQVYQSQKKEITVDRTVKIGVYIFTGAISALFLMLLINTFTGAPQESETDED
jgi:hypothetical protein